MRDKASRSEQEHEAALAAANAAIVQHAARALIRDCDTVQLASDEAHSRSGHCTHGHSTHRHSALLCFDEMQVSQQQQAGALGLGLVRRGQVCAAGC